jgi:hypothetical protein
MELVLICKQCGFEEQGQSERLLMAKIRMWNHLNREHPELTDAFSRTVDERQTQQAEESIHKDTT